MNTDNARPSNGQEPAAESTALDWAPRKGALPLGALDGPPIRLEYKLSAADEWIAAPDAGAIHIA
jgi:hypothetical protein